MQPVSTMSAADGDSAATDPGTVRLAAVCDTDAAAALKRALTGSDGPARPVCILADGVERITTPCIQVLLAADHALTRRGAGLRVRGATEAMRTAFADLGLDTDLARWTDRDG